MDWKFYVVVFSTFWIFICWLTAAVDSRMIYKKELNDAKYYVKDYEFEPGVSTYGRYLRKLLKMSDVSVIDHADTWLWKRFEVESRVNISEASL